MNTTGENHMDDKPKSVTIALAQLASNLARLAVHFVQYVVLSAAVTWMIIYLASLTYGLGPLALYIVAPKVVHYLLSLRHPASQWVRNYIRFYQCVVCDKFTRGEAHNGDPACPGGCQIIYRTDNDEMWDRFYKRRPKL